MAFSDQLFRSFIVCYIIPMVNPQPLKSSDICCSLCPDSDNGLVADDVPLIHRYGSKHWYLTIPYAPCMVYLPTKLGDFVRVNVGKYSSTMEHMGMGPPEVRPLKSISSNYTGNHRT